MLSDSVMTKKKYRAGTDLSISVLLENGNSLRVKFFPISNGKSVYTTEDEEIQNAIEKHHLFGDLIIVESETEIVTPDVNSQEEPAEEVKDTEHTVIKVDSPDDAKDYLAEKFGISRTKMRSIESIQRIALEHNIVFEGLK